MVRNETSHFGNLTHIPFTGKNDEKLLSSPFREIASNVPFNKANSPVLVTRAMVKKGESAQDIENLRLHFCL